MAIFIALGSNLGDRGASLENGINGLKSFGFSLLKASKIYETVPVGGPAGQQAYWNQVIEVGCKDSSRILFQKMKEIEFQNGRVRNGEHWGPRTLDLDLLCFHQEIKNEDDLTLPHPGIFSRRFVIEPWAEISPDFVCPGQSVSIQEALEPFLNEKKDEAIRVLEAVCSH